MTATANKLSLPKIASVIFCAVLALAPGGLATDGKWNADASDNWNTASRWTNSQVADGVDAVANISYNITAGRTVTLNSPHTIGRLRFEDATTVNNDWTLAGSGVNILTMQVSSGTPVIEVANRTATINAPVAGTQGLLKIGSGTLALNNAANQYAGKTTATNGTLRINNQLSLGPIPASFVADQLTLSTGAILMNNNSEPVIDANQGITLGAGGGRIQGGWGKPIRINSVISGSGSLTIYPDVTPGPIILNAANTYTGPTQVGTGGAGSWSWLEVNNSLASSSVSVMNNGLLGGTGPINGPVTVFAGGIISPGGASQAGTLACSGNVSLTNAFLNFDLADVTTEDSSINDLLRVGGDLTLNGTITVTVNMLAGKLANGTYRLVNYNGALNLVNATLVCSNPRLGATFDTSTPGQINMTIANGTPASLVWVGDSGLSWDVNLSLNFLNNGTRDVYYQGDAVTFDDTGYYTNSTGINILTPANDVLTMLPASVTVNTTNNVTLAGSLSSGRFGGGMNLYKGGTGTLIWQQQNNSQPNNYSGLTVVTNGTLRLGNYRVLGSTNAGSGTIVTNLGRIDVNGQAPIYEPLVVQGSGPDGIGAIINTAGGLVNEGVRSQLTLAGDTTFGGSGRWDVFGGKLIGNGFKLTKTGGNEIALSNLGDTGIGDMEINQGVLTWLGGTLPGMPERTISVLSNATLNFWALTGNDATTPFTKNVAITNANIQNAQGNPYLSGQITIDGTNSFNAGGTSGSIFTLLGPIVGPGALRKVNSNILELDGTNTYTGPTLITAGTLTLGYFSSLANTPLIAVSSGATLVLPLTGFTLSSGQTLAGAGSVTGDLTAPDGTAIIPGNGPVTLAISGQLSVSNAALTVELGSSATLGGGNDLITAGSLVASGVTTIRIVPLATLDTTTPYTIIQAALPPGAETNFTVVGDSRYTFTVLPVDSPTSLYTYLQVQVGSASTAAGLTWAGDDATNPTWWDTKTTKNWLNNGVADVFYVGDSVTFDDTAVGTTVEMIGTVQPDSVTLNNATKAFSIGGAGSLITAGLTGNGAGATTINNASANTFLGSVVNNSGTLTFANASANTFTGGVTNKGGTLVFANGADNSFGPGIGLAGGTIAFDQTFPATVSAGIVGAGQLSKANTNTLTLSAANSAFDGNIQVNNGTLRAGNGTALGSLVGTTTINGGALDVNGQNLGFKPVVASGAGADGLGAIINRGGQQQNALRKVTLAGDTTFGALVNRWDIRSDVYDSPNASLSTGGNAYKLTKLGAQDLWIVSTTVDPALGDIDIAQGLLGYERATTGFGDPARTLTIYPGATLGFYNTINPLNKRITVRDGGRIYASNASNALTGPITFQSGTGIIEPTSGVTLSFLNEITGDGGFIKQNTGLAVLNVSNSFKGDVIVFNGTLWVTNSYALGSNKLVTVNYNTAMGTGGNGTRLSLRGGITIPADVTGAFQATTNVGDYRCSLTSDAQNNTWAGPILLYGNNIVGFYGGPTTLLNLAGGLYGTNGYSGTAFFRGGAGFCGTIAGPLDAPNCVMGITDNTAWQFNSPNNAWYRTMIAYGRFVLGADNAACATAELVLGQSGSSSGTLDLNGFSQSVPSVTTINGSNHWITNSSTTSDGLFVYDGGTKISSLNGRIVDGASRKVALTVKSGTLTLLGANTYTGPTIIAGGTLGLGPSGSVTSPLIDLRATATLDTTAATTVPVLGAGQTLQGNGTINGSITFGAGSTVTLGASIGVLTVNNALTMQAGSTNVFELDKSATQKSDLINAGTVTYGGTLVLKNLGPALAAGDSFKLFNAPTASGAFTDVIPATPGAGLLWDLSKLAVDGTVSVQVSLPTTPTSITASVSGNTLTLSWPSDYTGWRLEGQTNALNVGLTNNWVLIPESLTTNKMSFTIDPAQPTVFYRLGYPTP